MGGPSIEIGVFAHNEEKTLPRVLDALLAQTGDFTIARLTIVSCGSTDRTDDIAKSFAKLDPRVRLLRNELKRGKARAINQFLERVSRPDLVVLVSGDVVFTPGALDSLLRPFDDPNVGMSGAHPVPENEARGVGAMVHVCWELHHRVARHDPKLGEAIALRAPVAPIPEWTCADEACFEADVIGRGLRLVYCADAIVRNRGASTLADWLEHRRRIARAHSEIEGEGYRPSTRRPKVVLAKAFELARERPRLIGWLVASAALEVVSWVRGFVDAHGVNARSGDWEPIESAREQTPRYAAADNRVSP